MRLIDADSFRGWILKQTRLSKSYTIAALDEMPTIEPEPRWTPCSERPPEDIRPVIVTWKNTDPASYYQYIVGKHYTGTACYKNGKWYWYCADAERREDGRP